MLSYRKNICVYLMALIGGVFLFAGLLSAQPENLGVEPPVQDQPQTPWLELIQKPKMGMSGSGVSFKVNNIIIYGVSAFPVSLLDPIKSKYENREQTISELFEITRDIANFYHSKGYFLAESIIPEQEIKNGVVEIYVLEGKPGKTEVSGNKYYRTSFIYQEKEISDKFTKVKGYFAPLYSQKAIKYQTLEKVMLLLNDNSKMKADITLRPGEEIGTTDLLVNVKDSRPIAGYLDYNNFGSEYASKHRAGFNINFGNFITNGDTLSFRGLFGASSENLYFGRVNYSFPLSYYGTKMDFGYSKANYELGKQFLLLNMEGDIEIYSIGLKHPKIRSGKRNLYFYTSFDRKSLSNIVFGGIEIARDVLSVASAGMDYDRMDRTGKNSLNLKVEKGIPDFLESLKSEDPTASRAAANTGGDFVKVSLDLERIQKIGPLGYLIFTGKGQWTPDDLVAPEQFSLGGQDNVRGYPVGDFLGDYGFTAGLEMRIPILKSVWKEKVQIVTFYDYGRNYFNTLLPGETEESIAGAGVGLRLVMPWQMYLRADCGWPVYGPLKSEEPAFYLQFVKFF